MEALGAQRPPNSKGFLGFIMVGGEQKSGGTGRAKESFSQQGGRGDTATTRQANHARTGESRVGFKQIERIGSDFRLRHAPTPRLGSCTVPSGLLNFVRNFDQ